MSVLNVLMWVMGIAVVAVHAYHLHKLVKSYWEKWGNDKEPDVSSTATRFVEFSKSYLNYEPNLEDLVETSRDEFLKDSLQTMLNGALRGHELLKALRHRAQTVFHEDMAEIYKHRQMGRFLPAIGWLTAITGVFWIFQNPTLELSASVGTVVVATLGAVIYGVVLTYLVVNPVCDYMLERAKRNRMKNLMVVEGIGLLLKKKNPYEILEAVNLALPVPHQVDWRDVFEEKVDQVA